MDVVLFRHAAAVAADPSVDDAARALSPHGRRRFARLARGVRRVGLRFDRLLHSPALRAVQTAELLSELVDGETMVTPLLAASPERGVVDLLDGASIAVVGHSPYLEELAGLLLFGDNHAGASLDLKKAGWIWLRGEPEPGAMKLRAFVPPRIGRAL
jgi:phosphohistidine phosphatase